MDTEPIRKLAESARKRGKDYHIEYQRLDGLSHVAASNEDYAGAFHFATKANAKLNDAFYWFGHANAYNGVVAMVELQTVVEDELDAEGSCP